MGTLRKGHGDVQSGVPFVFDERNVTSPDNGVAMASGVRRLTPRECEALQGFPRDWTRYDADDKELSDSARYRMLGNAVAVPVAQWIGRRIMANN